MIIGPNEKQLNLTYQKPLSTSDFGIIEIKNNKLIVTKEGVVTSLSKKGNIFFYKDRLGYHRVIVQNPENQNDRTTYQVHRLVLMVFRPIDDQFDFHVNHRDKDPENNHLDNLEWVTNGQNIQHARSFNKPYMDVFNRPCGVIVQNVFNNDETFFTELRFAAKYLGIHKDVLRSRLDDRPFGQIFPDGYRVKRSQDTREWKEVAQKDIESISNGFIRPVSVLRLSDMSEHHFNTMTEASEFSGISAGAICIEINSKYEPTAMMPKSTVDLYQFKYQYDKKTWKKYPTYIHARMDAKKYVRPVVLIDKEDKIYIFTSNDECAKWLGVGKTTSSYRLNRNTLTPHSDGFIYRFFEDWYPENKDKYSDNLIVS